MQWRRSRTYAFLGGHSDGGTEDLPRSVEVELTDFEHGELRPHFGESEALVRYELEGSTVDLSYPRKVLPIPRQQDFEVVDLMELTFVSVSSKRAYPNQVKMYLLQCLFSSPGGTCATALS